MRWWKLNMAWSRQCLPHTGVPSWQYLLQLKYQFHLNCAPLLFQTTRRRDSNRVKLGPEYCSVSNGLTSGYRLLLLRIEGYPGHFGHKSYTIKWIIRQKTKKYMFSWSRTLSHSRYSSDRSLPQSSRVFCCKDEENGSWRLFQVLFSVVVISQKEVFLHLMEVPSFAP